MLIRMHCNGKKRDRKCERERGSERENYVVGVGRNLYALCSVLVASLIITPKFFHSARVDYYALRGKLGIVSAC